MKNKSQLECKMIHVNYQEANVVNATRKLFFKKVLLNLILLFNVYILMFLF